MQEKPCCYRTCNLRYFSGVFVGTRVGSMYYVLLDLSRSDTPVAVISRRASEQHQQCGQPPEGPALQAVVDLRTHPDNVGACLPYYNSWLSQGVDT